MNIVHISARTQVILREILRGFPQFLTPEYDLRRLQASVIYVPPTPSPRITDRVPHTYKTSGNINAGIKCLYLF
jgi:hypothetical protein